MYKTRGIVLREIRYKDTSKIINVLTEDMGKISIMARGAYKAKSTLVSSSQQFSYNEYNLRKSRGIYYLNQGDTIDSFYNIRKSLEKYVYGSYLLELADKSLVQDQVNNQVFELLKAGLYYLSSLDKDVLKFVIAYEIKFISILGYRPCIDTCVNCRNMAGVEYRFSLNLGGLICNNCFFEDRQARRISKEDYNFLFKLLYTPFKDLDKLGVKGIELEKIHQILVAYILYILERNSFNSLKSLDLLT